MAKHPQTGEWIPPGGFPTLKDGTELRPTMSAAALMGVTPSQMGRVAKKFGLTTYTSTAKRPGLPASFFSLAELLEVRRQRQNWTPEAEPHAAFEIKTPGSIKIEGTED